MRLPRSHAMAEPGAELQRAALNLPTRAGLLGLLHEATGLLRAQVAVLASQMREGAASWQTSLEPLLRQKPALFAGCGAAASFIVIWEVGRRLKRLYLPRRPLPAPQLTGLDAFHRVVGGGNPSRRGFVGKHATGHPPMQVVLTGGPLGGKSSLAAHLVVELQQRGVAVFVAPSVAALFLNCGCARPDAGDADGLLQFECAVLQLQLALEVNSRACNPMHPPCNSMHPACNPT